MSGGRTQHLAVLQRTATAQGRSQLASSPTTTADATVALARRPHTRFVVARSALSKEKVKDNRQPTTDNRPTPALLYVLYVLHG